MNYENYPTYINYPAFVSACCECVYAEYKEGEWSCTQYDYKDIVPYLKTCD